MRTLRSPFRTVRARLADLRAARAGMSTVEFALVAPVFVLLIAGTVDFGFALHKRFEIGSALSAGANYALLRAEDVNAENAATLAGQIAAVVAGNAGSGEITVTVNVNNSRSVTIAGGEANVGEGDASADVCYCPVRNSDGVFWGASVSCGGTCPAGGTAGKFVAIEIAKAHDPLFSAVTPEALQSVSLSTFLQAQ